MALKGWNKNIFGNVHKAVTENQKKLADIQLSIARSSSTGISYLLAQEKAVSNDLNMALDCQTIVWKEKARMSWFTNGDRNTAFFHSVVRQRQNASGFINLLRVIL